MKILIVIRSAVHQNDNANIKLDNGNIILYKDYLILEFGKSLLKKNINVEIITLNNLKKQKNILEFLNKYKIVIKFSLRETIFDSEKNCIFKKSKPDIIFLESPILFRDPLKKLKYQKYIRIMLNENFGNNKFIKKYYDNSQRLNKMNLKLKKWKDKGEVILVINQLRGDSAIIPINPYDWLIECISSIRKLTNKKILIREHPLQKKIDTDRMQEILNGKNIFLSNSQTIHKDLEDAFTCVTFSSGSAIDSLIEGVPVIATDKRSFAYEISENNITFKRNILTIDCAR